MKHFAVNSNQNSKIETEILENFEKNIDLNQSNLNIIKKKISKNNIRDVRA